MAIDFTSAVGKVRLKTSDLDPAAPLLDDNTIGGYLGLHEWDLNVPADFSKQMICRASADIMDAMATSEVLLAKKIRTQDLATDGPAVATDLRKQAASLRVEADTLDSAELDSFDIIPNGGYRGPEGAERYW